MQKKFVESADGARIYYEYWMSGRADRPVCLLVHGIGGDTDGWQFMRDILHAQGFSTIALDVRGHGYSGHPRRTASYSEEIMLKDILAVIDAEALECVALVGHSGGAILSLLFALKYPSRLSSLVLLAGSYRAPAYMRSMWTRGIARGIIALGALISLPPMKPWHSSYPKGKVHREYEPWGLVRTIAHNSLASYLSVGRTLMSIDLSSRLNEVKVPTLIVVGEKDSIYPVAISEVMHEKITASKLKIIPDANHVLILNEPEETARLVIAFLIDSLAQ